MAIEILIIDDEADIRDLVSGILQDEGYDTRTAETSEAAVAALKARLPSLVVLDVWLKGSDMDGLELLRTIKSMSDIPVLMISGHGTLEMAVMATKMGAEDFLQKPFESSELIHSIERALNESALRRENKELRLDSGGLTEDIGEKAVSAELLEQIKKLATSDGRVFLWGERGVGKASAARLLHSYSERHKNRFAIFNCGGVDNFEELLLGIESGDNTEFGILEQSHGGSLLLEEIDKMPADFQFIFAKILQKGEFCRVGGTHPVRVNVRIMASSVHSPDELLGEGGKGVSEELYHRLNVNTLHVPPLRERRGDIISLFRHFLSLRVAALRMREPQVEEGGIAFLQAYDWPGNLSQLRGVVERLLVEGRGGVITAERIRMCLDLDTAFVGGEPGEGGDIDMGAFMNDDLRSARHSFEREYLRFHLGRFDGNIAKTAEFVGMDRASLHRKLKSLDLI